MAAITIDYNALRNPELRKWLEKEFHDELFSLTAGHDHDGVNSKSLSPEAVIANEAVTSAKILDGAVTASKIGSDAVTSTKILDGAVVKAKIGADAVDGTKLADNAVDSEHITAGAIDTAHIGNLQVTTAKIAADAIDGTKMADNAVDSEHITAGAIDLAHMSANSVDSDQYVDGSIDTVHIGNDQVTNDKLANISRGYIKVGGAADAPTDLDAKTDGYILVGDGTDLKSVAVSGDITITNAGVTAIGADKVTNTILANIARGSVKVGGASNAPTDLDAKGDGKILVGDGTDVKSVSVSGDITLANTGAVAIGAGKVTTAMLGATTSPNAKAITAAHAAAIPVTGNGDLALTIADAAETNSLAVPTFAGQEICISADTVAGTGSRTVTVATPINATGNNTILFDAAGEFIILRGIKLGATFAWRVVAVDGATLSTVA